MKSDIQIAQEAKLKPIVEIGQKLGLAAEDLSAYGRYKAKVNHRLAEKHKSKPDGKLILVTATSPTPAGEGKTTMCVGLADALNRIGKNAALCVREPSLGPVFGIKGGAAGGGYAQVVPMEDINLHFTGDLHAIAAANNLLTAMVDNHIFQGNELGLHPNRISWKRCLDVNDRQLRNLVNGLGGGANGIPRQDGFDITAASEVMAVFCLAADLDDLKERLARIVVGYSYDNEPVTCGQIGAAGAMTALLKDAFDPNLVQTLEHTPAFIHGGPFANIAHGCNSLVATRTALKLADYTVTEAGFGADLGAEKFLDIKCRAAGIMPHAVVIVVTVRSLKHHGACPKEELGKPNLEYLKKGAENLVRHIENIRQVFGLPACVAINAFPTDSREEHDYISELCQNMGIESSVTQVFAQGGAGAEDLAQKVADLADRAEHEGSFVYESHMPLKEKIEAVCQKVYRADSVSFEATAAKRLAEIEGMGYGKLSVCIAKTQYSFSDTASKLGAPQGFNIHVREVRLSAGAGFAVIICGSIMTMPGLGKFPSALKIDLDADGKIEGLF
ncbi:MAG: formate--tetrahydrofolate ligase [Clostridiales bacterium]|nr:formate--tetrahydrofolate ligase [Clostridiales bacterium]